MVYFTGCFIRSFTRTLSWSYLSWSVGSLVWAQSTKRLRAPAQLGGRGTVVTGRPHNQFDPPALLFSIGYLEASC